MKENYNNNIKSALDDIKVPDNISAYISKGVRKRRYQSGVGKVCKSLVAFMITIVTLGNLSPTIADEIQKVPGIGGIFKYFHWTKSLEVLEEKGFIENVNVKCQNDNVEFIVNGYVSDDKGIVIYYETRSKKDYYIINKYKLLDENNNYIDGFNGIQDSGIKKSFKNGVYYVSGSIKKFGFSDDDINISLVEKLKLSVNLFPLKKKYEEITSPYNIKNVNSFNLEFPIEHIPFEKSTIEFNKKIYEDEKFKITLLELGIGPISNEFRLKVDNLMDESQFDHNMVAINFVLSDGKSKYRTLMMKANVIDYENEESEVNYIVTTDSNYFSESEELYIEYIFITYYERYEEPLTINLSERTVCDSYKTIINFVDFEELENGGCIVTLSHEEGIFYFEEFGIGKLAYNNFYKHEKKAKLSFYRKENVEKLRLSVFKEFKIEKNNLRVKIK
ncbi:DUF4179 domain-containing protein [Oceanirhabdus sp. W0125-5]|uniref:DUF4179 domain-containing protein n=1 Tax=Oceanirhabdus sp. W0125-5 TaxID=2999116 RepID=UPI0022F2F5C0|nr:DUF4179 domain-containing protein [Oceanirhabdus sp. W0125-5]WBW99163.1 DUF4179 domain-containing protein [Oceanirhabdus sp. W0125-5]